MKYQKQKLEQLRQPCIFKNLKTKGENMLNTEELNRVQAAERLGVHLTKRVICPGCGKMQIIDALSYALGLDSRTIKEIEPVRPEIDGLKWCATCR